MDGWGRSGEERRSGEGQDEWTKVEKWSRVVVFIKRENCLSA